MGGAVERAFDDDGAGEFEEVALGGDAGAPGQAHAAVVGKEENGVEVGDALGDAARLALEGHDDLGAGDGAGAIW